MFRASVGIGVGVGCERVHCDRIRSMASLRRPSPPLHGLLLQPLLPPRLASTLLLSNARVRDDEVARLLGRTQTCAFVGREARILACTLGDQIGIETMTLGRPFLLALVVTQLEETTTSREIGARVIGSRR